MPFICTVCRDKLTIQDQDGQLQVITSTECGHIFHLDCLGENFTKCAAVKLEMTGKTDSTTSCPQCQREINPGNNRKIFPSEIEDVDIHERELREENENLKEENFSLKGRIRNMEMRLNAPDSSKMSTLNQDYLPGIYNANPTILPMVTTDSGLLKIGDLVVWFGADDAPHDGVVKWIGLINNENYSGVEFKENIGDDFPEVDGQRLFSAAPFRGRFVRTRELLLHRDYYGF